jgi:hypothetical protein
MKKLILIVATAALASTAMLPSKAYAGNACYQWSAFPEERFRLFVKKHGLLTGEAEEEEFGHARQTAYSVHGKEVGWCGSETMVTVTGTVITAAPLDNTTGQTGAHMGLEIHASRGDGLPGGEEFCRSGEFDCTTSEVRSTPKVWNCHSRNEFDTYHGASTLTKVTPSEDPLCSFFEDGEEPASAATATADGSAGGTRH